VCVYAYSPSVVNLAINGAAPVKMSTITGRQQHVMIDTKGARAVGAC
jgi:hypothetical protein